MLKQRLARVATLAVLSIALGGVVALAQIKMLSHTQQASVKSSGVAGADIGGPIRLTDQNGNVFTEKDFDGKFALIYFGFTYCPAICPTELQKMNAALAAIDPAKADQIIPVFITVDPERDTVEVMKNYVIQFHPRLIGLTGNVDDVKEVTKVWRVYAQKVQDETMTDYTMDHSSYIYLHAPDGGLMDIFGTEKTVPDIIASINKNIP